MSGLKAAIKFVLCRVLGEKRYSNLRYVLEKRLTKNGGYSKAYYHRMEEFVGESYGFFAEAVTTEFRPSCIVDVGCGAGGIARAFLDRGCEKAFALDYSRDAIEMAKAKGLTHVEWIDLTVAPEIPARGDLCLCLEVAEHLPEHFAGKLCMLLSRVAPVLIFTAAPPGQGGTHHVNEQPRRYWVELMAASSMEYDTPITERLRYVLRGRAKYFYVDNLMVFRRARSSSCNRGDDLCVDTR